MDAAALRPFIAALNCPIMVVETTANSALRSFDPDAETLSGINARNQNWDGRFSFLRVFPARHIFGGVRGVMKAQWQPEKPDDAALFRA